MAWYRSGTVSLTNGSKTVNGSGTQFLDSVKSGDIFIGPDGLLYEIDQLVSTTQFTLVVAYAGATNATASYEIVPTTAYLKTLAANVNNLISIYNTVPDNVTASANAAAASAAQATQSVQDVAASVKASQDSATAASGSASAAAGSATAADTSAKAAAASATNAGTSASNAAQSVQDANAAKTAAGTSETNAAQSASSAAQSATAAQQAASSVTYPISVENGGTGKQNASDALAALGGVSASNDVTFQKTVSVTGEFSPAQGVAFADGTTQTTAAQLSVVVPFNYSVADGTIAVNGTVITNAAFTSPDMDVYRNGARLSNGYGVAIDTTAGTATFADPFVTDTEIHFYKRTMAATSSSAQWAGGAFTGPVSFGSTVGFGSQVTFTGAATKFSSRPQVNSLDIWDKGNLPNPASVTPISSVTATGANGYGSGVYIPRFATVTESYGTDITYADSAAYGASFTLNTAGLYTVDYSYQSSAADWGGISRNVPVANLTTPYTSVSDVTQKLATAYNGVNGGALFVSSTRWFAAGTVLRPHTNGNGALGAIVGGNQMTVSRIY